MINLTDSDLPPSAQCSLLPRSPSPRSSRWAGGGRALALSRNRNKEASWGTTTRIVRVKPVNSSSPVNSPAGSRANNQVSRSTKVASRASRTGQDSRVNGPATRYAIRSGPVWTTKDAGQEQRIIASHGQTERRVGGSPAFGIFPCSEGVTGHQASIPHGSRHLRISCSGTFATRSGHRTQGELRDER